MKLPHSPAIWAALAVSLATAPFSSAAPQPEAAATPAPPAETAKPATDIEPYELKNKSSVSIPAGTRPPYWPIGWRPNGAPVQAAVPKGPNIDASYFKVTSILIGNPSLALINGRSYEEGQFIRMPRGSTIRPRVFRILDGNVEVQIDTQTLNVPLVRPKLNDPKGDSDMLNAEKEESGAAPIK
jgi:hypothetical protein